MPKKENCRKTYSNQNSSKCSRTEPTVPANEATTGKQEHHRMRKKLGPLNERTEHNPIQLRKCERKNFKTILGLHRPGNIPGNSNPRANGDKKSAGIHILPTEYWRLSLGM
jgi:hypothetical protein